MTVWIPAPAYDWSVIHFPGIVPEQKNRRPYGRGYQVEIEPSDKLCAELLARMARREIPPAHREAVRRAVTVLEAALYPPQSNDSTPDAA